MQQQVSLFTLLVLAAAAALCHADRETVNFDFGWRFQLGGAMADCPAGTFVNASHVQCDGLSKRSAQDAADCQNECCDDPECLVWQFEDPNVQGGGCWAGQCNKPPVPNSKWIGGSRE